MHMLQVLPPFSHRQRSGVEYFDVVPRALIRNIDPHKPHTLMPLGRADVRVGPMVYYGVRFWEVRPSLPPTYPKPRPPPTASTPHGIVQYPASVRPPPGAAGYIRSPNGYVRPAPPPGGGTPYTPRPPSTPMQARPSGVPQQDAPRPAQTAPGSTGGAPAAAARFEAPANEGRSETSSAAGSAPSPAAKPPTSPMATDNATPATSGAPPKTDAPPQGSTPAGTGPSTSASVRPPPPQTTPSGAPGPGMSSASPATPRAAPRPLDAGFLSRLQQRAEHDKHLQNLLQLARSNQLPESALPQLNAIIASLMVPPPPKPEEQGPPVVLVEFPENPSINFVLPLWHTAVERRRMTGARRGHSVLLSFFLPAIGSKAAGDSGRKDAEHVDHGMLLDASMWPKAPTPPPKSDTPEAGPVPSAPAPESSDAPKTEPESTTDAKRNARNKRARPKKEAPPPKPERGHELYPTTWFLRADLGIDERLWDCLGRVPGCVTSEPNRERMFANDSDKELFDKLQQSFTARFDAIPPPKTLPRSVALADIPPSLEEHITDRYAMRIQSSTTRPQPKRKVATLSDSREPRAPRVDHHVPRNYAAEILDGEPRPKRKRHVATHNPDGSLKSCGACGKTKTPMWRRGPKGPSQLCNACGAKWKAGRLVVPDVPPPPILDDTLPVRRVATPVSPTPAPAPP